MTWSIEIKRCDTHTDFNVYAMLGDKCQPGLFMVAHGDSLEAAVKRAEGVLHWLNHRPMFVDVVDGEYVRKAEWIGADDCLAVLMAALGALYG